MECVTTTDTARRRETRARLVAAALQEFGRHGIDGTSVEQLCEAAGFTRGAFYSNFATKDDLCVAIVEDQTRQMILDCEAALQQLPTNLAPIEMVSRVLGATRWTEDEHRTQLELELRSWRNPELGARVDAVRTDCHALLIEVVDRACQNARISTDLDIEDIISLFEALFLAPALARSGRGERLIPLVADKLIHQED